MFRRRSRLRRRRGAVMVEYAFLLVAVGIPTIGGVTYAGQQMYMDYTAARDYMLLPFP